MPQRVPCKIKFCGCAENMGSCECVAYFFVFLRFFIILLAPFLSFYHVTQKYSFPTQNIAAVALIFQASTKLEKYDVENLEILLFWSGRHSATYFGHQYSNTVAKCRATCEHATYNSELVDIHKDCQTFPVFLLDPPVGTSRQSTRARRSFPCVVRLGPSSIPGAGLGVFANFHLSVGTLFGPYMGLTTVKQSNQPNYSFKVSNLHKAYTWEIDEVFHSNEKHGRTIVIDGFDEEHANWLRFINSARYDEEQNLVPYTFNLTEIYYFVCKDIQVDSELLVWYGPSAGAVIGITADEKNVRPMELHFAAPKKIAKYSKK